MPARVEIGSAEYNLLVNMDPFRAAFVQAEKEAAAAASKIEGSLGRIKAQQTVNLTIDTSRGDAAIKQTQARLAAIKDETVNLVVKGEGADRALAKLRNDIAALEQRGISLRVKTQETAGGDGAGGALGSLGGGIKAGLGFAGVTLGAQLVGEAYHKLIDVTLKTEQAQKALNIIYGDAAVIYNRVAKEQAAAAGVALSATQQAVTQFATLRANYGLTSAQIEKLTKLTLDYAAVTGKDVVDVSHRLQSALRGEAEAAEELGLTLNSDAVKAFAAMTAEQRKNFETLDQVSKAQIIYNELLRQSANVQGAASKNANTLQGSFNLLAREGENLGKSLGEKLTPALIALNQFATENVKAIGFIIDKVDELIKRNAELKRQGLPAAPFQPDFVTEGQQAIRRRFGGPSPQVDDIGAFTSQHAVDEGIRIIQAGLAREKEERKKAAEDQETLTRQRLERAIKLEEDGIKLREDLIKNQLQAIQDEADAERQVIEAKRDADIEASRAATEAALDALEERRQAAAAFYAGQIEAAGRARDIELRGIEAQQRSLSDARRAEDRERETRRDAERRAIEANGAAIQAAIDAERRGIEANRDAALKALDERAAAEDRRHAEAMRNLDEEEQRQLGEIDAALKALDKQEEAERRRETDRGLEEARRSAQRDVKTAKTPEEKRRAQKALADAERAIERERRRRERDNAREALRERAAAIRKEFDARKQEEIDRNKTAKDAIDAEKQQIDEQTKVKLDALNAQLEAVRANQAAQLQALQDRYKEEDRIIEDRRRVEDRALEDRKKAVEDAYQAQVAALRKQAQESERYYADEKKRIQDAGRAQQDVIRKTAEAHLQALRKRTQDTIRELQKQTDEHRRAAERVVEIWKKALADVRGFIRAEIRIESSMVGGTGGGTGDGNDEGNRHLTCPPGYTLRYTNGFPQCFPDNGGAPIPPTRRRAAGGTVERRRPYIVGENGPELFVPSVNGEILNRQQVASRLTAPTLVGAGYAGAAREHGPGASVGSWGAQALTVSPTIHVDARGVPGAEQVSELVVAQTARLVVGLLDRTEKLHATAVDRRLGGAL